MKICKWFKKIFKKEISETQKVSEPTTAQDNNLAAVTYVSINTISKNWDEDAEKDGIDIEISLRNKDDHTIDFKDGSLSGNIYIHKQEGPGESEGEGVYNKTMLISKRIKIPFEDVAAQQEKYGVLYVDVTLPDGRVIKAKEEHVKIKI